MSEGRDKAGSIGVAANVADASRVRNARMRNASATKTLCIAAVLTVAAATAWMFAIAFVGGIIEEITREPQREHRWQRLTFRKDGLPVWKVTVSGGGQQTSEYRDLDSRPVAMKDEDEHSGMVPLVDARVWRQPRRAVWPSRVVHATTDGKVAWFFHDMGARGVFAGFDQATRQPLGFLSLRGHSTTLPAEADWFPTHDAGRKYELASANWTRSFNLGLPYSEGYAQWSGNTLLFVEPSGKNVHAIDVHKRVVRLISEGEPVLGANLEGLQRRHIATRAVLRLEDKLKVVSLSDPSAAAEFVTLPASMRRAAAFGWLRAEGQHLFVRLESEGWQLIWADRTGTVIREELVKDTMKYRPSIESSERWLVLAFQMPLLGDVMVYGMSHESEFSSRFVDLRRVTELGLEWPRSRDVAVQVLYLPLALLHATALIWSALAVRRLRKWNGSARQQCFWAVWNLVFGLPGYLAFRVHRTWPECARRGFECRPLSSRADLSGGRDASATPPRTRRERATLAALIAAYERCLDTGERFGAVAASCVGLPAGYSALVLKECRLAAGLALLASGAYFFVLARLMEIPGFGWMREFVSSIGGVPFLSLSDLEPFTVIGVLLAVSLGVWQLAAEARGDAWLFLLHRPVSRRAIVVGKLTVGLLVLLLCTAMPIVLYAAWAARSGTHPAPFEWSMTDEAWRLWAALSPLYLATFLTMLRPARWWGTRLLPVVVAFFWLSQRDSYGVWLWPWWREIGAVVLFDMVLVICLLLVIREREYP